MAMESKKEQAKTITLSVIKADIGGWVGHSAIHPALIESAGKTLAAAKAGGLLVDYHVSACGDDLQLIMTHRNGVDHERIHRLAWETFEAGTQVAKDLHLYGAGQDLLADAFSGNVRGQGPGVAEMEFIERKSEPVLIFMADKTSAGAWNLPLYKMFADPFTTAGLVIAPAMHQGFRFEVHDIYQHNKITFDCPEELYDMLMFIGSPGKYTIKHVFSRADGTIAAATSTERLSLIAGKYVGKDDPVMIVRAQQNFPAVGEVLEPFRYPWIIEGWMRGSHNGPLMPVSVTHATPTRFDGPPRVACLGFQLADGRLIGPRDMFDDVSYDEARRDANRVADFLRLHGPFEPHRLPLDEMEYTTMPQLMKKLEARWAKI
ncbi:MAG TPA: fructose-1,6-bisphosphate aldolase/phosphatase [Nitrospira sp.]|nr:fructose-1,6-bisphosphate aldolase/phosphatase [Nitrospira sp.]